MVSMVGKGECDEQSVGNGDGEQEEEKRAYDDDEDEV